MWSGRGHPLVLDVLELTALVHGADLVVEKLCASCTEKLCIRHDLRLLGILLLVGSLGGVVPAGTVSVQDQLLFVVEVLLRRCLVACSCLTIFVTLDTLVYAALRAELKLSSAIDALLLKLSLG